MNVRKADVRALVALAWRSIPTCRKCRARTPATHEAKGRFNFPTPLCAMHAAVEPHATERLNAPRARAFTELLGRLQGLDASKKPRKRP